MATRTSVGSGLWSAVETWDTGVPLDGDTVVVASGHTVTVDVDLSAWATGIAGLTIQGGATPGMLGFKNDADGTYYLRIKAATNLAGTTSTNRGRLFMAGGTWEAPTDAADGRKIVIELLGAAAGKIDAANLDIIARCTQPVHLYARTYKAKKTVESVDTVNDTLTITAHGYAANTPLRITSTGELPGGLEEDHTYYARSITANTFKLVCVSGADATLIDLTSVGSGTIEAYTGHDNLATKTLNVLDDVTADPPWSTVAGYNAVVLANESSVGTDQQRDTLAGIAAGTLILTALNVDSAQAPGAKVWLASRNVAIRSNSTGTGPIVDFTGSTHSGCTLQCEIRNLYQPGTVGTSYGTGVLGTTTTGGHTISGVICGVTGGVVAGLGHLLSATIVGCSIGVSTGVGHTISGRISGVTYGISGGTGHLISATFSGITYTLYGNTVAHAFTGLIIHCDSGHSYGGVGNTIAGTIFGCSTGVSTGIAITISGLIKGCSTGVSSGTSYLITGTISHCGTAVSGIFGTLLGATLTNNATDLSGVYHCTGHSVALKSAVKNTGYKLTVAAPNWRTNCFYDVADSGSVLRGQVEAWGPYGTITTEAAPGTPPVSLPYAYKHIPDSTIHPVFLDFLVFVRKGETLTVTCYAKLVATGMASRPKFQLLDPAVAWNVPDPASNLDTETAADTTDWQTLVLSHTETAADRQVILRCQGGQGAAAAAYWHWMFAVSGGLGPSDDEIAEAAWNYAERSLTG